MSGNRTMRGRATAMVSVLAAAFAIAANAAAAQSVEEFYKGRTIILIVGSGASGGDDTYARIFARYLPKYLPGSPSIVVQNQPGAGGILAASNLYNTQPRDAPSSDRYCAACRRRRCCPMSL